MSIHWGIPTSYWTEKTLRLALRQQISLRHVFGDSILLSEINTAFIVFQGPIIITLFVTSDIFLRILVSDPCVVQDTLFSRCYNEISVQMALIN